MPVVEKYEMLFGDLNTVPADYKVSIDAADEAAGLADFLWNKVSPRNKVGESRELDTNKNLIPCELRNERVVLSPSDSGSGSATGENVIMIDSYHIIESTDTIQLASGNSSRVDLTCFPFQFATGQIKTIVVQQAQAQGPTLSGVYMAIYTNDKPGLTGARLVWSSPGTNAFDADGKLSFSVGSRPVIPGYTTVGTTKKPNTFFYVLFAAQGSDDGGYRLLGLKNAVGFNLLSNIGGTKSMGIIRNVNKTDEFHPIFDYDLEYGEQIGSSIVIPHITFEMVV